MKKTIVMNLLTPVVLLLLTLFFVAEPASTEATGQTAAAAPEMGQAAVASSTAAAPVATAERGARAATQPAVLPEAVPVFSIEVGEVSVCGSEAEADAIESAGVLNRLELFEF